MLTDLLGMQCATPCPPARLTLLTTSSTRKYECVCDCMDLLSHEHFISKTTFHYRQQHILHCPSFDSMQQRAREYCLGTQLALVLMTLPTNVPATRRKGRTSKTENILSPSTRVRRRSPLSAHTADNEFALATSPPVRDGTLQRDPSSSAAPDGQKSIFEALVEQFVGVGRDAGHPPRTVPDGTSKRQSADQVAPQKHTKGHKTRAVRQINQPRGGRR